MNILTILSIDMCIPVALTWFILYENQSKLIHLICSFIDFAQYFVKRDLRKIKNMFIECVFRHFKQDNQYRDYIIITMFVFAAL